MDKLHREISIWSFIFVIAISFAALAGWLINFLSLASIEDQFIPMAPATGALFLISGIVSLVILKKGKSNLSLRLLISMMLLFVLMVLGDSLSGYPLAIESFFSKTENTFRNFPLGRMSPLTSGLFVIGFIGLLTFSADSKFRQLAAFICSFGLFISFILDLGYLYGTPLLYNHTMIPPALNTSVAFTLFFTGLLSGFGMNERPLKQFMGDSVRSTLMRGFFPIVILIVVLSGWTDSLIFKFFNDHVYVTAIVTVASLFALSIIIARLSKKIGHELDNLILFRKETEEKLRESELHFRTLSDSGQALIWTSGIDKKCNYFNKPWLEFTGRSLEQELGDGWTEGVHPDDLDRCFEIYNSSFDKRHRFSMDYRLFHHDGTYHWIQDVGTPRFNIHGEFVGYIGHCLDITERKIMEEAIRKSEERYRLISSVATDYTFSTKIKPDGTGEMEWIAGAFESISGYTIDEYKNRGGWRSIIHPDDLHLDDTDFNLLKANQNIESQIRTINKNGEIVWVQIYAHPIWNYHQNCLKGIYGAVKNITDRKNAEERLKNSEVRFRELLENVNLMAIILDTESKVVFCNDYLLQLTEYTKDELVGVNWFEKMIPEDNSSVFSVFTTGIKDGKILARFENQVLTKSGKRLDIVWSNVIQRDASGQITGVASIGEDVTEQKLAEEKIRLFNEELERRVVERTEELEQKNDELARMNKLFVGRELRMIELKNKISDLEAEIKSNKPK